MTTKQHQTIYHQHQAWLAQRGMPHDDPHGAAPARADLTGAVLTGAKLTGAKLTGAVLTRADLDEAKLTGADLRWADLRWAKLTGAVLTGADLTGADLRWAKLTGADLRWAKLTGAVLDECYIDIPVTLDEVRDVIADHLDRLDMDAWHSDDEWHNGHAHAVEECGTSHCLAGWAHHLAALRRPELLDPKINVHLVGRLALGEEAASHFFDDNDEVLEWLGLS